MAKQSSPDAVPVLLTRPEAQSRDFARAMVARYGARVRPVVSPLMAVEFLRPTLPDGLFAGVIFTSAQGVEAAGRMPGLPKRAFCVGARTADRARQAGFQATSADGDATALVAAILADPPAGRLLHLRGEEVRGEVAERLSDAGIGTETVVAYRQRPVHLTAKALELLRGTGVVIVPLFSPRSAALFCAAVPVGAQLAVVAMSGAVAEVVTLPTSALVIAKRPDAEAMLDAVGVVLAGWPLP